MRIGEHESPAQSWRGSAPSLDVQRGSHRSDVMRKHWLTAAIIAALGAEVAIAEQEADFQPLILAERQVAWRTAVRSEPTVISFALVTGPVLTAGARNCARMVPNDDLLARSGVDPKAFEAELKAAFYMWETAANLRFVRSDDWKTAGILIGAQADPTGFAFTNVTHGTTSETASSILQSLICLNPERHWKVGFDGNLTSLDLRYVLAHEIGHAIGLDHPGGSGQLMSYRYEERFRSLQDGDKRGAALLYGPNGVWSRAAPTAIGAGATSNTDMGIAGQPANE